MNNCVYSFHFILLFFYSPSPSRLHLSPCGRSVDSRRKGGEERERKKRRRKKEEREREREREKADRRYADQ